MNVLVIGQGGREHAMARVLLESSSVKRVFALPGREAMKPEVTVLSHYSLKNEEVLKACKENKIDLVVIGPEDPLVSGLSDFLRHENILVFGPDQRGAQLEGSKFFAKEFMVKYGIPTAPYKKVNNVQELLDCVSLFTPPYVFKADGLAAGKGVFICKNLSELENAARLVFEERILGTAGDTAIIEQFQPGYELSYFILTNGEKEEALPMAQDHKKLFDGDRGPNTGGMGTIAPMKIDKGLMQKIKARVIEPTVRGLSEEGFNYRGVVFIGLMITSDGPQVLEYNVRFGDPETQVLLPLLDGDWGQVFLKIAQGEIPNLKWLDQACACVVVASENYPNQPVNGAVIEGLSIDLSTKDSYFLHAGTAKVNDQWVTQGGRVLNVIGIGKDLNTALEKAYQKLSQVKWKGMQFRKDIGHSHQAGS